jgi:hypothetical protein
MSILIPKHDRSSSYSVRVSNAQVHSIVRKIAKDCPRLWEEGFRLIWDNPSATPAEMIASFGTDAKELFELSETLFIFISTIMANTMPDKLSELQELLALRQPYTVHEDGTITLDDA